MVTTGLRRTATAAALLAGMATGASAIVWNFEDAGVVAADRSYSSIFRDGDFAAALWVGGIVALDLSQPVDTMVLGSVDLASTGLDVLGRRVVYCYRGDAPTITRVGIFDFSDEGEPVHTFLDVPQLANTDAFFGCRWLGEDKFLVWADPLHYFTVDESNAIAFGGPVVTDFFPQNASNTVTFRTAGSRVVANSATPAIQDFSDPTAPAFLGFFPLSSEFRFLDEEYAIYESGETLQIVDVGNVPHCPVVGELEVPHGDANVQVDRDDWRMAVNSNSYVHLYDISSPHYPTVIGMYSGGGPIAVRGNVVAQCETPDPGVRIMVHTGPQQPRLAGNKWIVK